MIGSQNVWKWLFGAGVSLPWLVMLLSFMAAFWSRDLEWSIRVTQVFFIGVLASWGTTIASLVLFFCFPWLRTSTVLRRLVFLSALGSLVFLLMFVTPIHMFHM